MPRVISYLGPQKPEIMSLDPIISLEMATFIETFIETSTFIVLRPTDVDVPNLSIVTTSILSQKFSTSSRPLPRTMCATDRFVMRKQTRPHVPVRRRIRTNTGHLE